MSRGEGNVHPREKSSIQGDDELGICRDEKSWGIRVAIELAVKKTQMAGFGADKGYLFRPG